MQIRCKLERDGGSVINVGGSDYHFKPKVRGGPHVCDVTKKDDLARFLAIPEAYEIFDDEAEAGHAAAQETKAADEPKPATGHDYNGLTRKELNALYKKKFGRLPSPRTKDETIVKALIGG